MVFTKKVTKAPAVMVETKKLSGENCTGSTCCPYWMCVKHFVVSALVLLNTVLLVWVLCNQTKLESDKVGGAANYKMVQQIYKTPAFKAQQTQQIQQALQMYEGGAQTAQGVQQAATTPEVQATPPAVTK